MQIMFIGKNINNDGYGFSTMYGFSLSDITEDMRNGKIAIIDSDNPLFQKIKEVANFEPIIENGELVDIIEKPPIAERPTPQMRLEELNHNAQRAELILVKSLVNILPELYAIIGKPIPIEVSEALDVREVSVVEFNKLNAEISKSRNMNIGE